MRSNPICTVIFSSLLIASVSSAGTITVAGTFSDDASSGIGLPGRDGPGIVHGANPVVVNGVTFATGGTSGTFANGITYAIAGTTNQFGTYDPGTNYNPGLSGNVDSLANNFFFDGSNTQTLTLGNLTPGATYNFDQYNFAFGPVGLRVVDLSDNQGGSLPNYDEDTGSGTPFGTIIQDTFVAPASGTLVISYAPHTGDAYHQYNLQITQVAVPEPASLTLLGVVSVGALVRRRRAA